MSDITTDQLGQLSSLFRRVRPECDADMLAQSVAADVNHWRRQEAAKRIDGERIQKALKKVDAALAVLAGVSTDEGLHLLHALTRVKTEAGNPVEKSTEVHRGYLNWEGGDFVQYDAVTVRKNTDDAALIWCLQGFWIKHFNERPTNYREHSFYEMAAIILQKNAEAVFKYWGRNAEEPEEPEERE
jgi:hypothetical protein